MQTFLPHPDFRKSARCLDRQRLGKQRVETKQILTALTDPEYGWQNHPAVKMWRGYEGALAEYGMAICAEWIGREYRDTLSGWFLDRQDLCCDFPAWLGDERLHASHRACLLAKAPEWYAQWGWTETPTPPGPDGRWPYWWPSEHVEVVT